MIRLQYNSRDPTFLQSVFSTSTGLGMFCTFKETEALLTNPENVVVVRNTNPHIVFVIFLALTYHETWRDEVTVGQVRGLDDGGGDARGVGQAEQS